MQKKIFYLIGLTLLLAGVAGFVLTSPLFGLFEVNKTHNWVHLVSGLATVLYATKGEARMKMFGRVFGVFYLLVGILGFLVPDGDFFAIMWVNLPDNILHLVVGGALAFMGFYRRKAASPVAAVA